MNGSPSDSDSAKMFCFKDGTNFDVSSCWAWQRLRTPRRWCIIKERKVLRPAGSTVLFPSKHSCFSLLLLKLGLNLIPKWEVYALVALIPGQKHCVSLSLGCVNYLQQCKKFHPVFPILGKSGGISVWAAHGVRSLLPPALLTRHSWAEHLCDPTPFCAERWLK